MTLSRLLSQFETREAEIDERVSALNRARAERDRLRDQAVSAMDRAGVPVVCTGSRIYRVAGGTLLFEPCEYAVNVEVPEPAPLDKDTDPDSRAAELPRVSPPYQCDCPECDDAGHTLAVAAQTLATLDEETA